MARHGSHADMDVGSAAGGGLAALLIVVVLITIYLTVKACVYIIHTFRRYAHTVRALWYSLGVFLALSLSGGALALIFQRQEFLNASVAGFLQLLITCVVVQRQNADTFMVQDMSIQEAILKRSWWADEQTPLAA